MYVGRPPSLLDAVGADDGMSEETLVVAPCAFRGVSKQHRICGEQGALEKA